MSDRLNPDAVPHIGDHLPLPSTSGESNAGEQGSSTGGSSRAEKPVADESTLQPEPRRAPRATTTRPASHRPTAVRWDEGTKIVCQLLTGHPEKNLARAVCSYLAEEMPDMEFVLRPRVPAQAVWICGYESGQVELVREARRQSPEALVVVTGRAPLESWRGEVLQAGADHACGWPLSYAELSRLLHDKRSQAIA